MPDATLVDGVYENIIHPATAESEMSRLANYCGLDEARIKAALSSIELAVPPHSDLRLDDRRALELYENLRQRSISVGSLDVTDTVIRSDADETRLLKRAEELKQAARIDAAVDLLTKGLSIRPHYRASRFLLGYTLMETGHIARSAEQARALIKANPHDPVGHGLHAFGLTQQARIEEAILAFRECLRCLPDNNVAWSNLLFASLYGDHHDEEVVTRLHIEAAAAIERTVLEASGNRTLPPLPKIDANRLTLRIGYLSGDLRKHPVGYFMGAILQHHDRQHFSALCYHSSTGNDELTGILRGLSDVWCDATVLSDVQLASRIRQDQVDLLIDLSGHSAGNRVGALIRRAAPVQAMYLCYP